MSWAPGVDPYFICHLMQEIHPCGCIGGLIIKGRKFRQVPHIVSCKAMSQNSKCCAPYSSGQGEGVTHTNPLQNL